MTILRDDPEVTWRRVSPKQSVVELVGNAVFWLIVIGVTVILAIIGVWWAWWAMGAAIALLLVSSFVAVRRVKAYGYQLRDDDLVFRRGIMFLRVVAVPYGRMQLIDINRGPVARAVGLSELKFVTAAASSAVVIPGLPMLEAEELRDHLVALAESRRAGL